MNTNTTPAAPTHAVTFTAEIVAVDRETAIRKVSDSLWYGEDSGAMVSLLAAPPATTHAKLETFTVLVTEQQAAQLEHFLADTLPIISGFTAQWSATPGVTPEARELTHADCDECGVEMAFDLITQRCPNCHTCECGLSFTDEALRNGYLFCAGCGLDHRPEATGFAALSRTDLLAILADRDPEVTVEMLDLLGTEELREILTQTTN